MLCAARVLATPAALLCAAWVLASPAALLTHTHADTHLLGGLRYNARSYSFVKQCIDGIEAADGLEEEGLYRIAGQTSKVTPENQAIGKF